jgi:proliferating cell nuclear antigen
LITALKDILTDATITFTSAGLKILNFDKTQTIFVNVNLYAEKFEEFVCVPEKIIICVNTDHLYKLIQVMSDDDTISIYIESSDYHDGIVDYLSFQYDNPEIKQRYTQKLRLLETDMEDIELPDINYQTIINLQTNYFQKMIRDLRGISEQIEIKSVGNDLIFSCDGPFSKSRIDRTESDGTLQFVQKPDSSVVIQGIFSLKSLQTFTKCSPLCTDLEIYLGNDLPLIVKYFVASLGDIKLCLSPLSSLPSGY